MGKTILPASASASEPRSGSSLAPPYGGGVIERPRVTALLADAVARHAVVQVVAAAGAGKTTAVAHAAQALPQPVAWLTLEEWHSAPGRLCDDLARVFAPIVPGVPAEVDRARARGARPSEIAGIIGSLAALSGAVVVLDDSHAIRGSEGSVAALARAIRLGRPRLRAVIAGRAELPLPGVGVESLDPGCIVGDEALRATPEEAAAILRGRPEGPSPEEALEATDGWVAGLAFEVWRSSGPAATDRLGAYLRREVRPRLSPAADSLMVASSLLDEVDPQRARALGADDPAALLAELRAAGVPAFWGSDGARMRMHPAIRESLAAELRGGPGQRHRSAARAAASVLEREGDAERAADLYLEVGDGEALSRIAPDLVMRLIDRRDIDAARRHLDAVRVEPEPASLVLARLVIALLEGRTEEGMAVLARIPSDRMDELVRDEPAVGAFACHFLASQGRLDDAARVLAATPPGRAADTSRLALSLIRDDPGAPLPGLVGDVLDASLTRLLWSRGRFAELRAGRTAWLDESGVLQLGVAGTGTSTDGLTSPIARLLVAFNRAVELRDVGAARECVAGLARQDNPTWALLCDAEMAVRLERDPGRARAAAARLRRMGAVEIPFDREIVDTWDGGALLLAGEHEAAAAVLAPAVESMRDGDRRLLLATALVYLAEALWRVGEETASDAATTEAHEVATSQGGLRFLIFALSDFPGVLSRRLDAEPADGGPWRALGRALATGWGAGPVTTSSTVYLREFGSPAIVVGAVTTRPKITKSLELLSFLVTSPDRRASRSAVLDALWASRDDDATRTYLRQSLRQLRAALPDGVAVHSSGDELSLEGAITSESLEFDALVVEAAHEVGSRRLALLLQGLEIVRRGPFLPASHGDGWVEERRRSIAEQMSAIQLDAAEFLLDDGQLVEALALVREALGRNRLLERGWRLRMRAHGLLGDGDGLLAAFRACTDALAEIGLRPSAATAEVARTFRR